IEAFSPFAILTLRCVGSIRLSRVLPTFACDHPRPGAPDAASARKMSQRDQSAARKPSTRRVKSPCLGAGEGHEPATWSVASSNRMLDAQIREGLAPNL